MYASSIEKNLKMYLFFLGISLTQAANIPVSNLRSNRISNSLNPSGDGMNFAYQDWVKITESSPKIINKPLGSRVELECEAIGSPAPTIQWLQGDRALTDEESYESNMISENRGIAKVTSRFIINSFLPVHQGQITCVATSGTKTALSDTTIFLQGKVSPHKNFSDYLNSGMLSLNHPKVRIVLFNTFLMQEMGNDIILPCKAVGTPKPDVFWVDNNQEQILSNQDPRVKILPDGELSIQGLNWSDMGSYTCIRRNDFSKDSITTFVYPVLSEN